MDRATRAMAVATVALVAAGWLLRLVAAARPGGTLALDPDELPIPLASLAGLCVVLLAGSRAPRVAWVAGVGSVLAAAVGLATLPRDPALRPGAVDPVASGLLLAALVDTAATAAAYASLPPRWPRSTLVVAWSLVGVLAAVLVAGLAERSATGTATLGVPRWAWLLLVAGLVTLGAARDLRAPVSRARARASAAPGGTGPVGALRLLADELVPGREASRAEAAESERGRLAADLHADVLPSLRRALVEAEAGGTPERLAADLRSAVDEVESLLAARRSVVLEELGLLAAVEWLAERTEERSDVRVVIDVESAGGGRPPRDVERAAFRVAQLALDNVARHAPGSIVRVVVGAGDARVRLVLADDGPGPGAGLAGAARDGRRGIADMRAEARACGAEVDVGGTADGGRGTVVRFAWPG